MPLERVSVGFRDISLSLKRNPLTKDVVVLNNIDAISRAIKNLVLTLKGEKFFEPTIGSLVNNLLFENLSSNLVRRVRDEIKSVILNNEPRVVLLDVDVIPNYEENILDIVITYEIIGMDALPQQLTFVLLPAR